MERFYDLFNEKHNTRKQEKKLIKVAHTKKSQKFIEMLDIGI